MSNSPNNHVAIFASRGGRAASLAISLLIAFASPMAEAQSVADPASNPASNPAMRAPLDIIPTPMRAAVGTLAPIAADQDTKLAPRVQARQMNRAMRAVLWHGFVAGRPFGFCHRFDEAFARHPCFTGLARYGTQAASQRHRRTDRLGAGHQLVGGAAAAFP